jgi:putative membrane protein
MRAASLVIVLAIYAAGVWRLWTHAGIGCGIRRFEAAAFGVGWLGLAIALSPPLDEWSEEWLFAHMVQHELLMVVAAPLIAVSAPLVATVWALPAASRRRIVDAVRHTRLARLWAAITSPASVFVLYGLALWFWHIPALYDFALEHEAMHVVQHLCFFATATLFWWGIAHGG